ncbi:MAG: GxxExxY protein [Chitinophagales bacterium]|nr:GxxExxY protein [Chitinophagales bacterium]
MRADESVSDEHELQLISYLKATEIEVGILFNFGEKLEIRKNVFSN